MITANCKTDCPVALPDLAVVCVSGPERVSFLQGQLTNDVTKLGASSLMCAGWCSPKGRLLAVPRLVSHDESILLIVAAAARAALVKRLKMYVLRSKVEVREADEWSVAGAFGDAALFPAGSLVFDCADGAPETLAALGLPSGRKLALVPREAASFEADSCWRAAAIAAGEVWIGPKTADQFVPQAVNLELIGGVSFSKGCYTGQEVVSRIEHIGKTPRRAAVGVIDAADDIAPMTDVLNAAGEVVGTVVDAAVCGAKTMLFVQLPVAALEADFTGSIAGMPLALLPLPYGYARS